jgi:NADH-quinone oxidoreductase subunit N
MLIPIAANNPLGMRALLYYLVPYCAMSIGAFAVVAARERELGDDVTLDNLAGLGWERPFLGVAMWIFMLGFAGFPLTGGFVGKFYAFSAAYDRGWIWLMIVGVAATLVSLYYYLGVVRAMYFRSAVEVQIVPGARPPREAALQLGVFLAVAVTVGSFFAVQPLIDIARRAAASIPI